ncbi:MAG: PKD domain-containing protein [Aureispira sp.]|nr:PKD domain-containing protein [Aureispira sp.]
MKKCLLLLFLLTYFSSLIWGQETKRALFLGNSYTQSNNLPVLIDNIAKTQGDTLVYSQNTPGGYTFQGHSTNGTSMSKIRQGNWDFVVMQEQSQRPSFPDAQVATIVYPYAQQINDTIEKYNACGETMFFMTWGRENGDPQWAPISTYDGMQSRLTNAYLTMTVDNEAVCSPVGAVWKYVRDSFPTIGLYTIDGSHPSIAGSYLAACTFYAAMYRKSPVGSSYYAGLSPTIALNLQNAAAHVVLDSMSNWHLLDYDVQASYNTTVNLDTVVFSNSSQNATSFEWNFDDGSTIDTTQNPTHIYSQAGNYNVQLIASDDCGNTDTSTVSITVSVINGEKKIKYKEKSLVKCYPNPTSSVLYIKATETIEELQILNTTGQVVWTKKNIASEQFDLNIEDFHKGVFLVEFRLSSGTRIVKKLAFQ